MRERVKGFGLGLVAGATAAAALIAVPWTGAHAGAAASAADVKYASRIVLENDRVRVREVTFPPGVPDTGMHTHEYAHVGVILTKGALVFTEPGADTARVDFEAGSVGFREANVTHQVANPGTQPMRVIEVELKK